jgi:sterol desaturase/sphingolipid hydroxylase (fatty acid hydroxylase superfamily)
MESSAYWVVFVATFLGFAVWESFRPKHDPGPTQRRWYKHGILLVICTVILVGVYRISPVVLASNVTGNRFGLLNKPWIPFAVRCILAVLVLDLLKYAIHRLSHAVPLLWRFHQVHHSDPQFDVSTGLRVHPIEVTVWQGAYLLAVAVIAPPVVAVLIVELLSVFQSFFSHANASLPHSADQALRMVFVTPDMHRTHHSDEMTDQFSNLSDIFPWWDRLFGTYSEMPVGGADRMVTGLKGFQNDRSLDIAFMLAQPFRSEPEQTVPAGPVTNV